MLDWKRNLPLRKRGLVADVPGARFWIHRHETGRVVYRLAYRLPGGDHIFDYGHDFRRLKFAKEIAGRIAENLE